jgi:hypothetical protein
MSEGFAVISGAIKSDSDLNYITETAKERYVKYKTAHHEWINKVEPSKYRTALDNVRTDSDIFAKIKERFPNSTIKTVPEADEIYWAVSPKGAGGSDRSLVDCHYDSPFSWIPTGGPIYYRIIIACNENNTVTTTFPDENMRVKMNTKEFHGLDYNKDLHCVEGQIPEDRVRVLLKLHYIIIPKGSEAYEDWVRNINVLWTVFSREAMRMSAEPDNWYEYIIAFLVNFSRVVFKNFNFILTIVLLFLCCYLFPVKKVTNSISKIVRSKR